MFDTGAALFTFIPFQRSLYETLRAVDIGTPLAGVIGLGGLDQQTITIDYPSRKWKANSGEFYQIGPRNR